MTWNFDLSSAPRDGSHVILAVAGMKPIRSYWVKPKHEPEHWCMLSHKTQPIAWMDWPVHPHHMVPADLAAVAGEVAIIEDVGGGA